jgi:hypothetical protein
MLRVIALFNNVWKRNLTAYRPEIWPFNLVAAR